MLVRVNSESAERLGEQVVNTNSTKVRWLFFERLKESHCFQSRADEVD